MNNKDSVFFNNAKIVFLIWYLARASYPSFLLEIQSV